MHSNTLLQIKNGGVIISASAPMDNAKSENIRAMIEFTKEYGRY